MLEQAIIANGEVPALHNRLGVILATRLKEYPRAVRALERAIDLDPDNFSFKNNLGKILSMQADDEDGAPKKKGGLFGLLKKDDQQVIVRARKYRPKEF
mgnify:CR=1 FL=1